MAGHDLRAARPQYQRAPIERVGGYRPIGPSRAGGRRRSSRSCLPSTDTPPTKSVARNRFVPQ
eukprot:3941630-Rhodomonas_salina.1